MKFHLKCVVSIAFFVVLSGCSTGGDGVDFFDIGGNRSKNSQIYTINSTGGVYKVGNPYQIFGTWYYPKEDYHYSEVGVASWYGKDFHAKNTANGEKYDMNTLTAAHRTLPLPSIVKVTNLQNGRSVILRVNDRGPYAKNRVIDISKRGAEILGFQAQGTTKVKVEILPEESKKLKAAMLNKKGGDSWVKANNYQTPAAAYKPKKTINSLDDASYAKKEASMDAVIQTKTITTSNTASNLNPKYIQAGSFANQDSAENLKNQLDKFGKSFVAETVVDGNTFYRVRLGPYRYDAEAEVVLNKVRDYGIYNAKIVSK